MKLEDIKIGGSTVEIPYGYCQCGCGKLAPISSQTCRKYGWIKGEPKKFIKYHEAKLRRLPNGSHKTYRTVGQCRREHIDIVERVLGKPIPHGAVIHHWDENIHNNTSNNLVLCQSHAYHKLLHNRTTALKECSHANWRKCCRCHQWDAPENLVIPIKQSAYHQKCNTLHQKAMREEKNGR